MVDFLLIIFCVVCLIRGILREPVNESISIAGIVAGLMVASAYYTKISFFLFSWIDNLQMRSLCGFLLFFGFIVIAINFALIKELQTQNKIWKRDLLKAQIELAKAEK